MLPEVEIPPSSDEPAPAPEHPAAPGADPATDPATASARPARTDTRAADLDADLPGWLTRGRSRLLVGAMVVLAILPMVFSGLGGIGRTWYPGGDWAIIGFDTMDVGTAHTPLVGVYSRYGWNHPGPMLYWLYAIPYRLSGGNFSSLLLAAALINALAVAAMIVFAWRRGGLVLAAFTTVAITLVTHTLSFAIIRDPWNPWVAILPFGAVIMAAWAAGEGDTAGLVTVALVGAYLMQTHVGFVPMVGLLALVAGIGFWRRRRAVRPLAVAGGIFAFCWIPVLVDLLTGGDNLHKLLSYFLTSHDVPAGVGYAVQVADLELGGHGAWLGGAEPGNPIGGGLLPNDDLRALALAIIPFAIALGLAWANRRRAPDALRLLGTVGLGVLTCVFAVSRITGPVFSYLVRWWWPTAALWWVAIAYAAWRAMGSSLRPRARTVAAVGLCVALTAVLTWRTSTVDVGQVDSPDLNRVQAPLALFVQQAMPQVPRDRPVMVRSVGASVGWVSEGAALQLAAAGFDVQLDATGTNPEKYGTKRMGTADPSKSMVWVAAGSWVEDFQAQAPSHGGRQLYVWDPLPPDQRVQANALRKQLRDTFKAANRPDLEDDLEGVGGLYRAEGFPGVTPEQLRAWNDFQAQGQPFAVFLFDRADQGTIPQRP